MTICWHFKGSTNKWDISQIFSVNYIGLCSFQTALHPYACKKDRIAATKGEDEQIKDDAARQGLYFDGIKNNISSNIHIVCCVVFLLLYYWYRLSIYRGYIWNDSAHSTAITMMKLGADLPSRTTPYTSTSPLRVSYGVTFANKTKKNHRDILRVRCSYLWNPVFYLPIISGCSTWIATTTRLHW